MKEALVVEALILRGYNNHNVYCLLVNTVVEALILRGYNNFSAK